MSRIFISYRRDDSADASGRLYDRLAAEFGKESVFKDVDNIPLGMDFRSVLREAVGQCEVMLAVIGRQWVSATDEHGRRRLENPADFVRIEVETALERNIAVIPVLVQNAAIPSEADLPPSLAALAYRNGIAVRADPHFHGDVTLLIGRMAQLLGPSGQPPSAPQPAESTYELVDQGIALGKQQKYAEALAVYDRALALDPNLVIAWNNKADALWVLKRYTESVEAAGRAIALDPDDAQGWIGRGAALNMLYRHAEAVPALERATALDPNKDVAWNNLGVALNSLKRYQEAVAAFERALSISETAQRWKNKANSLRALGRTAEAEEAERRAKELGG